MLGLVHAARLFYAILLLKLFIDCSCIILFLCKNSIDGVNYCFIFSAVTVWSWGRDKEHPKETEWKQHIQNTRICSKLPIWKEQ